MIAYLDTHVAVWLYAGLIERLSAAAKGAIEGKDLLISPMVLIEFQYLFERKRISVAPAALQAYLNASFGVVVCGFPFQSVALAAVAIGWTADPFDRIIVGQAIANRESPLITADTQVRRHYPGSIW